MKCTTSIIIKYTLGLEAVFEKAQAKIEEYENQGYESVSYHISMENGFDIANVTMIKKV
ncbi:hypothetical protein [Bacillus sp. NPDC094106]|uniref:hypothetical protein n=1 Tax=Bacillus sp. NPDC094106 TaxID=3363949 RepID=UPI00381B9942